MQPNVANLNYFKLNNPSLENQKFTLSGCKDIGYRKFMIVAKAQFPKKDIIKR